MAIYEVKGIHHRRAWVKGDLEAEDVIVYSNSFSTRKEANKVLESKKKEFTSQGYKRISMSLVGRGDKKSQLVVFTDDCWTNENTGEKHEEYYWYRVTRK